MRREDIHYTCILYVKIVCKHSVSPCSTHHHHTKFKEHGKMQKEKSKKQKGEIKNEK